MNTYPLTIKYLPEIAYDPWLSNNEYVKTSHILQILEAALAKGHVVWSCRDHAGKACGLWSNDNHPEAHNTHEGLLLGPVEIKPQRVEVDVFISSGPGENSVVIPKEFHGKKVKVTIEEVP